MQQVVFIHGGDAFPTYEDYLAFLKGFEVDLNYFLRSSWNSSLQESLGAEYQVIAPKMPNKLNAKYLEWKIWFEKLSPFVEDNVILIGHSLGAAFLAKYLSTEKFPKTIKATLLIAPPFDDDDGRPLVEFNAPDSLNLLAEQGGEIFIYHSKDDPVVPFTELEKFKKRLPSANIQTFEDRGHFNQEEFPELINQIKSL